MSTKYSVGDKVSYVMPTSRDPYNADIGIVTRIDGISIWTQWNTGEESWFEEGDASASILERAVKPEITKEIVEVVLKAFVTTVMSYNSSFITDCAVEKTIATIKRDSDPEYAEYLRLKSKFDLKP